MNENNLPNIEGEENVTPVAEEATEAIEEVIEAVEEAVEEVFEETFETELSQEDIEYVTEQVAEIKKKGKAGKITAIVVAAVLGVAVLVTVLLGILIGFDTLTKFDDTTALAIKRLVIKNPYNEQGYVNFSGRTVADVAQASGMTLEEFLAAYGLPADMPSDTTEESAYYNIPLGKFTEQMYGIDIDTFKQAFQLGDDVTENTPYGEAEGKVKLSVAIGDEGIEEFKQTYGLGDEITGDTLWSEVRPIVERKA